MAKLSPDLTSNESLLRALEGILTDITNLKASVDSLETLANANKTAANATMGKLDTDGGVNDSNYKSSNEVTASDATAMPSLDTTS